MQNDILLRMSSRTCNVFICGAGITGVAAAYFLTRLGINDILLADEQPPLSLTSDHSTECYRNWWPDANMLALMNCSIDWLENLAVESRNVFRMNRRGYLYVTADREKISAYITDAQKISDLGAGQLRIHNTDTSIYQPADSEDFYIQPSGADLLLNPSLIHRHFPYLSEKAVAALHIRRAGWLSAQQLGMYLLEQAHNRGVRFVSGRLTDVDLSGGRVTAVRINDGQRIEVGSLVLAPGPFLKEVGSMLGVELPVYTELHLKASIRDTLDVLPRQAPLLIWDDPQTLAWSADEFRSLAMELENRWLTKQFPPGVHVRPEGGSINQTILMLWEYQPKIFDPIWPLPLDKMYPEIALLGLTTMLPEMRRYLGKFPHPQLDGGYYTRTRENRPLVGPLPVKGAYVIGAVSGFGIMSACGTGELLATHVAGDELPPYASAFLLGRYNNPEYQKRLETMESGQL